MGNNAVTKENWIELFRAIGLDEQAMHQWHQEFENRYPDGHQSFLEWLGISADDIRSIRSAQ